MRSTPWKKALVLTGVMTAALAGAEEAKKKSPPPMEMPKPAAELTQLAWLEGEWRCEGTQPAMRGKPAIPFKSSMKATRQLDGHWFSVGYKQEASPPEILGWDSTGFWGYDATEKAFVMALVDSSGGSHRATSPGWQGNELVWTGELHGGGRKITFRRVLVRTGERSLEARWEYQRPDGQWHVGDKDVCKK
jgi:hypothetical protein